MLTGWQVGTGTFFFFFFLLPGPRTDCLNSLAEALSELRSCVKVEVAVLGSRP